MSSLMASVARVSAEAEQLEATSGAKVGESSVALLRQTKSTVLPTPNMDAVDGKSVYSLEDIIPSKRALLWKDEAVSFEKMSHREKIHQGT